jgi:peptide/nickel transport system substrate-binding protein
VHPRWKSVDEDGVQESDGVMKGRILALVVLAVLVVAAPAASEPVQTPKRGGTLIIGTRPQSEPGCLNVLRCELQVTLPSLLAEVLPGAFEVMPDATFRPDLADARIASTNPFTLVYRIRPEARWSDGVPVTASDFVFTDLMRKAHLGSDDIHRNVRSVRPLAPKKVRVVMHAPLANWHYLFGTVLPRHALAGEDFEHVWVNDIDDPRSERPIGSGAFLLAEWERGKQLTFVRNPRYWGPHLAYLERLVFRFLPLEDIEDALRSGAIDMIDPVPAVLGAASVALHKQPAAGVRTQPGKGASFESLVIRIGPGGHPALASPLVRRAVAYGVDRAAIARANGRLSGVTASDVPPVDSLVFLPNRREYRPNWSRYRHSPAEARRLLRRSGCRTESDGVFACAGERMSLEFVTAAGVDNRELTARLAKAQLRKIGVEVTPVFASPPVLFGQKVPSGDFDVGIWGYGAGASTGGPLDLLGCRRVNNVMGYCDHLVTRELVRATRMLDDTRRAGLLNSIDEELARDVPLIPLFQHGGFTAYNADLKGVVPNGPGSFAWNLADWWLDD